MVQFCLTPFLLTFANAFLNTSTIATFQTTISGSVLQSGPIIKSLSCSFKYLSVKRNAGFLDDLFQGKFSGGTADKKMPKESPLLSETDFRREVQKRTDEAISSNDDTRFASDTIAAVNDEGATKGNNDEFDGYALRDAIYGKWGYYFDIDFQPVQSFGFKELYLNVLPFRMGSRKFRHETEYDYLCHLQAVVEILLKYDQLEYVLTQLEETKKKPRAGTVPIIAVPFRLDLTEDELDAILA